MTIVLAIAVTALVVGAIVGALATRRARSSLAREIGARLGEDPIDAHRRIVATAQNETASAEVRVDLLRLSLDALTSGVVVTDHAGKVLVRNRLAPEVSARSHEQTLVQATTTELLGEARRGNAVEREVQVFGPPQRTLFVHAVPIRDADQVVGALAVIDDVSDHHRIEKVRRDFVANLSHELRTPVGAVSLLAEMMVGEDDADTRAQLTNRLLIETDRMAGTIDGLLELSRLESTTQEYADSFAVQDMIDEAVSRNKVSAEAANVHMSSMSPTQRITMVGNRDQMLTATVNLVENAIKYSSAGDQVSVRARVDGDMLALIVQDTGRGIPARDVDRIFERFYRVDRSRDASTGGTGIGLSIVRHVALNHGGRVSVESFEGDGSTFTMTVPLIASGPSAQPDLGAQLPVEPVNEMN